TSEATARQAREEGIELVELPAAGVDLAVDGMDELAPSLDAIKGLGGALLREKVVAASARRFVLVGDESKLVSRLGEKAPVPVEVVPCGLARTVALLAGLGADARLRPGDGRPFVTDNGNHVVDCRFAGPFDPEELQAELAALPGVVEHGLFLGMADLAFVAGAGGVRRLEASGWSSPWGSTSSRSGASGAPPSATPSASSRGASTPRSWRSWRAGPTSTPAWRCASRPRRRSPRCGRRPWAGATCGSSRTAPGRC